MFRRVVLITILLAIILFAGELIFPGSVYRIVDRARMALRHLNPVLHYSLNYRLPGTPDLKRLDDRLAAKQLKRGQPIFIRVFKSESTLELWMKRDGRFALFATYPICYWSGRLGPKLKTGDHQAPEGFYTVSRDQLNPNSRWHRSFNLGFPNSYDRTQGRTGSFLMVHGGCASVGCYAMTNGVITELWELINAALDNGQARFGVHVFPFRLTDAKLNAYKDHRWAEFWRELKPGYDLFEEMHVPPEVTLCKGKYAVREGKTGGANAAELRRACPPAVGPAPG